MGTMFYELGATLCIKTISRTRTDNIHNSLYNNPYWACAMYDTVKTQPMTNYTNQPTLSHRMTIHDRPV